MIDTVGGCNVLLGIIAMAQDVESLYAGVKALTCVVRSNRATQSEMDRKRSYQTLAMFFKKKKNLLNSHILHLTFSLVGTVNSGQQESSAIPNVMAFQVGLILGSFSFSTNNIKYVQSKLCRTYCVTWKFGMIHQMIY